MPDENCSSCIVKPLSKPHSSCDSISFWQLIYFKTTINERGGHGLSGRPRGHIWGYKYIGKKRGYRNAFLAVFPERKRELNEN